MIRKNKKFIDPRYFMDEKVEGGALDQLDEGFFDRFKKQKPAATAAATAAAPDRHADLRARLAGEEMIEDTRAFLKRIDEMVELFRDLEVYKSGQDLVSKLNMQIYEKDLATLKQLLQSEEGAETMATQSATNEAQVLDHHSRISVAGQDAYDLEKLQNRREQWLPKLATILLTDNGFGHGILSKFNGIVKKYAQTYAQIMQPQTLQHLKELSKHLEVMAAEIKEKVGGQ